MSRGQNAWEQIAGGSKYDGGKTTGGTKCFRAEMLGVKHPEHVSVVLDFNLLCNVYIVQRQIYSEAMEYFA